MRAADFQFVAQLVRDRSAIALEPGKEYLVESRLAPVAHQFGLESISAVIDRLRRESFGALAEAVVEAMTTNETSFFRDVHPFVALREQVLPDLIRRREADKHLRVWCGAASSGQEPYSLAMTFRDTVPFAMGWTLDFLCTDLSRSMIARCEAGLYSQQEVNRGLPAAELVKSFRREGLMYRVSDTLRRMVRFESHNLVHLLRGVENLDLVFLRNVLIYFDVATKRQVLTRVRHAMRPGGYLFLGTAETTHNLDGSFQREQAGRAVFYRAPEERA